MKSFYFAISITIALLCVNIFLYNELYETTNQTSKLIDKTVYEIQNESDANYNELFKKLEKKINNNVRLWQIASNHSEVDNIESTILEVRGYMETKTKEHAIAKLHALKFYVNNIFDREKITFANIL